jgi:hypothetical protein
MTTHHGSSLPDHPARKQREGFVRVEVSVRKEDAGLVRDVAAALADPARRMGVYTMLRPRSAEPPHMSLKALLAAAPLDGIDLERLADIGRDIDF